MTEFKKFFDNELSDLQLNERNFITFESEKESVEIELTPYIDVITRQVDRDEMPCESYVINCILIHYISNFSTEFANYIEKAIYDYFSFK